MKPLQFVVAALLVPVSLSAQPAQSSLHPLDGMGTAEYWTVYDALQSAGHMTPETKFTSVLLHPPEKSVVLDPPVPFLPEESSPGSPEESGRAMSRLRCAHGPHE